MAWWENVDATRLLIAPDSAANGKDNGRLLSLRHPKSGASTSYLFIKGELQEVNLFKHVYRSWFLGNYVCEDGSIYTATPVDPVFMLLPIFEEARMKRGDDPGKFRQLDEIIFINGYPGYQHLIPIAETCMQVVCEIKEMGSSKFFRLDDSKVLAWLSYKACKVKQTLLMIDQNYAAQDDKETLAEAVSILGEYVKDEPWLKLLCNHLSLNLSETTRRAPVAELLPNSMENNPLQESSKSNGKSVRSGRQAKKAKVETGSRNIKEMFGRASRRS